MIGFLEGVEGYLTQSPLLAVAAVFVAGVLTSFTPCVYPMIPIIVGYIGGSGEKSRFRAFLLSLFYVIGLALTYAALGAVAALTGALFGRIQTSAVANIIVGNVILLFGLSSLGVFTLPLPSFMRRGATTKRRGLLSAAFMGSASGLVAAPCTAAVLGVVLTYVASRQNVPLGMLLLFVFALGMGVLLLIIGTFVGALAALPRAGRWTIWVEKLFGWGMLALGEYFIIKGGSYLV